MYVMTMHVSHCSRCAEHNAKYPSIVYDGGAGVAILIVAVLCPRHHATNVSPVFAAGDWVRICLDRRPLFIRDGGDGNGHFGADSSSVNASDLKSKTL